MLTEEEIQELMEEFDIRAQEITNEYLERLGEHLFDLGEILPSDAHQMEQLERMNGNLDAVKDKMRRDLNLMDKDIDDVLLQCAANNLNFGALHFGTGLTADALAAKKAAAAKNLARMVSAQAKITKGTMRNLSQTTILSNGYRRAVDVAVQSVQTGMKDYQSAIRSTLKEVAREGLRVKYPNSGITRRLDTAVRQNIIDGVRSLNQAAAMEVGEVYGADGVEISAHPLCAEDHVEDQGTQKTKEEFDNLQNSLPREFGQWNCKHFVFPVVLGISTPAYTKEQLEEYKEYSREEIEIDGVTHTRYEWSQKMRALETKARYIGDERTIAKAAHDKKAVKEADAAFRANVDKYNKVCAAAGIKPEYTRMVSRYPVNIKYKDADGKDIILGRDYAQGEPIQRNFVNVRAN